MPNLKEAGTCCPVKVVRMPANFYAPSTGHSLTLDQKRYNWSEEIKKNEEFLAWFRRNEPYLSSLEFQAYDKAAQEAETAIKKLRNQIRYARR